MPYDPGIHHRHSIRLKGYDYSQPGTYFITIVTQGRSSLFGEIVDGKMRLNNAGKIVQQEWRRLGQRFPHVELDAFVVMPNHIHGIVIIHARDVGATHPGQTGYSLCKDRLLTRTLMDEDGSPLPDRIYSATRGDRAMSNGPAPRSLGAIIGQFKARVTKRLWTQPGLTGIPVWQRNYYEHIIRDEDEYSRLHRYIGSNPIHWQDDAENR